MRGSALITLIYLCKRAFAVVAPAFLSLHSSWFALKLSIFVSPSASHRATVSSQRLGPPFRKPLFHATHKLPNLRINRGAERS